MDRQYEKRKKMVYQFICDELCPDEDERDGGHTSGEKGRPPGLKGDSRCAQAEGKIHRTQKGNYIKGQANRLAGMYQAHARGFGFVSIEGSDDDVFIPEEESNGALQGDEVEIQITRGAGKREGLRQEGR